MTWPFQPVFALLVLCVAAAPAFGLGADHPKGPIGGGDKWPAGLLELVNRPDRVHGFWVNWEDVFFYSGDTQALNEFLACCAKLPNTKLKVVLHPGPKKARSPWDKEDRDLPTDWTLYTSPFPRDDGGRKSDGNFHTQVDVYLGRQVRLADLKVPAAVVVESGGEIEKFVRERQPK